jgi:hypothetical protein
MAGWIGRATAVGQGVFWLATGLWPLDHWIYLLDVAAEAPLLAGWAADAAGA